MLAPLWATAGDGVEAGGHVKVRATGDAFDSSSVFHDLTGSAAGELSSDLRINLGYGDGPWSFDAAWQLAAAWGDAVELAGTGAAGLPSASTAGDDGRRRFDLADTFIDRDRLRALHRLDRLAVGWSGDHLVMRLGRQAISWGNGLAFSPMDIVNPFDPQAIDIEYKAGDDMFYAQYLRDNGDDLQFAHVFRRDPLTGSHGREVATTALKYHGIAGEAEYDLLVAEHYDRLTIGVGGNIGLGGSVLRGDAVLTDTAGGREVQLVVNLSRSWTWNERNVSGLVEYYHAGFGLGGGRYDLSSILLRPELAARLARGEAFTVGQNYLAAGMTVEMNPLWTVTPNLFTNLDDGSSLVQLVSNLSLGDESVLLFALNVPIGPDGSEYGGIDVGGRYLSRDLNLFLQFARYF